MRFSSPHLRGIVAACAGLLAAAHGHAQALPGGAQLGMSVAQLRQAVPALKPVPRPARLAGGLVGSWSGPEIDIAGIALAPTYFFADAQLRRVEYVAAPGANGYEALVAWGRSQWGTELASRSPEGAYAAWASGELDAYLQQTGAPQHPQVRLVVKRQQVKDGGEL